MFFELSKSKDVNEKRALSYFYLPSYPENFHEYYGNKNGFLRRLNRKEMRYSLSDGIKLDNGGVIIQIVEMGGIYIIFIAFAIISWLISNQLKVKFAKYSKMPIQYSGKEIAERMLRQNGIDDVKVLSVEGQLTDHYNPANKTVNLSRDVYYGSNVAAAAVAAHETGHAVQHASAYAWLQMRSALVPVVSFASRWVQWVLLAGILVVNTFPQLLVAGIILFASTTFFSIITLPVEVNASHRALVWLKGTGITNNQNQAAAFDALKWAAYTYFIAALASLATLVYYVLILMGARNRD
ncbi:MAG: putative neutral zinc metallopeptidase [Bacteroidetes bacterium ADurb.Bin012]|jgi:hypothetical protein|nr:MAG: putative neutral zinc metallopeptidase [Bacteroidetes bacterium ADurb.Bin012]